ncbi:hypothetical protein WR25_13029 [Diploscapter pachys]|uniref:Uncharacterized protein n=1 Tax=Diploscapter pachys TaxID=2018661 RepID=A0A2A2JUN2_9BILA|nr:hypothetical protein WR25_13029 [Diploscapter pachys]
MILVLTNIDSSIAAIDKKSSIPLEYQTLCRFSEVPYKGEEGNVNNKYTLRGATIIFRHGERSSIEQKPSKDCGCFKDEDRKLFEALQLEINSEKFVEFVKIDPQFTGYPRTPHRTQCAAGMLTAEGGLMINRMSSFLRSKYLPARLFSGNEFYHILRDHGAYFVSHGRKELVESFRAVQSLPGLKNSMDPLRLVDKALGNYICRRKALPCANGHCLTYDLLSQIFSGHDVSLTPLARCLRFPYIDPPYYATRMVFEIYDNSNGSFFIRVLYDGVDVTSHLSFCKNKLIDSLCPATLFQNYFDTFLQNFLGISSVSEVCKD